MSFEIGDRVESKCLHCGVWHNWEVRTIKPDDEEGRGAVAINRVGDGEKCGCVRQLVKPESIRPSRLEHRKALEALVPGALVLGPAFWDKDAGYSDELVEYEVQRVVPSVDVTQPCYNVRLVCERMDAAGKRHCHFFTHGQLEIV